MATIYLDMDGTFVDLYGVKNWLAFLLDRATTPYEIAKPLVNLSRLARYLNTLQRNGHLIGVISWCSKNSTKEFDERIVEAKLNWLKKHLPSVQFDKIHIVPYGTPKNNFNAGNDILFDDEVPNRQNWTGQAFSQNEIFEVLAAMRS